MIPARPYARSTSTAGVPWTRTWLDALGRPVASGTVQLEPVEVTDAVRTPVSITLHAGTATTQIAPGTYQLTGQVVSVDGHTAAIPAQKITIS